MAVPPACSIVEKMFERIFLVEDRDLNKASKVTSIKKGDVAKAKEKPRQSVERKENGNWKSRGELKLRLIITMISIYQASVICWALC